jgi:hypothetical protein
MCPSLVNPLASPPAREKSSSSSSSNATTPSKDSSSSAPAQHGESSTPAPAAPVPDPLPNKGFTSVNRGKGHWAKASAVPNIPAPVETFNQHQTPAQEFNKEEEAELQEAFLPEDPVKAAEGDTEMAEHDLSVPEAEPNASVAEDLNAQPEEISSETDTENSISKAESPKAFKALELLGLASMPEPEQSQLIFLDHSATKKI